MLDATAFLQVKGPEDDVRADAVAGQEIPLSIAPAGPRQGSGQSARETLLRSTPSTKAALEVRVSAVVLLTVEDAAEALALGRTKIYELLDAGLLRSVKIGRARRIPLDAVHEFVRRIESAESARAD